jgi:hypothetical protein
MPALQGANQSALEGSYSYHFVSELGYYGNPKKTKITTKYEPTPQWKAAMSS